MMFCAIALLLKKPGFWPNLRATTKYYRKNPVSDPSRAHRAIALFKPTATARFVTCKSLSTLALIRAIDLYQSNSILVKSDKCKDFPALDKQTDNCVRSSSIPKLTVVAANFYKYKSAIAANVI
jgi:hypothetical protein